MRFWQTVDSFSKQAETMRKHFDQRFEDSRSLGNDRFVWDYWHVPNQYTFVRTPAAEFFPKEIYNAFLDELLSWGQNRLGCQSLSEPWLSYYVDGCEQNFHSDVPQGPWAYVFSLTPWEGRPFSGGETEILTPQVCQLWQNFSWESGLERSEIIESIEPLFNRLTIFDPRFPHGVKTVQGTKDPQKARLVIHGWFAEPSPYCSPGLSEEKVAIPLNQALEGLGDVFEEHQDYCGFLSLKITVSPSGEVTEIEKLVNNLVSPIEDPQELEELESEVAQRLTPVKLPRSNEGGFIVLPLIFQ